MLTAWEARTYFLPPRCKSDKVEVMEEGGVAMAVAERTEKIFGSLASLDLARQNI